MSMTASFESSAFYRFSPCSCAAPSTTCWGEASRTSIKSLSRRANNENSTPKEIAKAPKTQSTAKGGASGRKTSIKPRISERIPPTIGSDSSLNTFRSHTAALSSSRPLTIAQAAMMYSSVPIAMDGQAKVMIPAAIPTNPSRRSTHQ